MTLKEIAARFRETGNTQASLVVEEVRKLEDLPEENLPEAGEALVKLCHLISLMKST